VDVEVGQGLAGANKVPLWIGCGARFVFTKFEKKKNEKKQSNTKG